ncbi:MAG: hypothetical protein H6584_00650 [Flavobacteriales bacterium]|nr:hypothetical protein [Flavobacteriales bacterium]
MAKNKKTNSVIIHNIKNSLYRQVHVDGAHGGITPNGFINVNFFSQRGVIPKGTEFELNEEGQITKAIKDIDDSKQGIVREFEFGAYMDINTCISIKEFLERKIEEYKSITKTI